MSKIPQPTPGPCTLEKFSNGGSMLTFGGSLDTNFSYSCWCAIKPGDAMLIAEAYQVLNKTGLRPAHMAHLANAMSDANKFNADALVQLRTQHLFMIKQRNELLKVLKKLVRAVDTPDADSLREMAEAHALIESIDTPKSAKLKQVPA